MSLFGVVAAGPFFVMATSAVAETVVFVVEELFPGVESGVDVVAVAVLLIVEPVGVAEETLTTTLNVAETPGDSDAMLHEIVAPVVQLNVGPFVCDSETNVVFAGSVSSHDAFTAFDGPAFATVIVYVMLLPANAEAGALFVIDMSACALIVVTTVALLFAEFVSALDVDDVAVLLNTVPFAMLGCGCTVIVNCALPPLGRRAIEQMTVPPPFPPGVLQIAVGPVFCVSETKFTLVGRLSVNAASVAASGPLFESVMM